MSIWLCPLCLAWREGGTATGQEDGVKNPEKQLVLQRGAES